MDFTPLRFKFWILPSKVWRCLDFTPLNSKILRCKIQTPQTLGVQFVIYPFINSFAFFIYLFYQFINPNPRLGPGRMPWLYTWSKFHASHAYDLWFIGLVRPKLLGILWKQYAKLTKEIMMVCLSLYCTCSNVFIPKTGLRSTRYNNKLTPKKKKKKKKSQKKEIKWNTKWSHFSSSPLSSVLRLPPPLQR